MQTLFDYAEARPKRATEQERQLKRVTGTLAWAIELFFDAHHVGETFHAADVHAFVAARVPNAAPGSADRVMRNLRKSGNIAYTLLDRRQSLYRKDATECETA